MNLEATHLRDNQWAVKPEGQLGTCGFHPEPWQVCYVKARDADQALRRARQIIPLEKRLRQAEAAFHQNPTPSLSSSINAIRRAIGSAIHSA